MKSLSVRPFTLWVQMVTSTRPPGNQQIGVMPFGLGDLAHPIREVERAGEVREHEGAGDSAVFGVAPSLHLAQVALHPGGIHRGHPAPGRERRFGWPVRSYRNYGLTGPFPAPGVSERERDERRHRYGVTPACGYRTGNLCFRARRSGEPGNGTGPGAEAQRAERPVRAIGRRERAGHAPAGARDQKRPRQQMIRG